MNLTKPEVGLLGSAQYLGVLGVVFLSGYFSDRFGRKKIILAGVIMFTTFTWTIAIAQNFFWAFLFRFLSGIGEGLFWPVAMAAVAETFSGRKGVSLGIFYVGFDVGSVAGLAAGAFVYTIFESWRYTFLLTPLAGIPVIIGILLSRNNLETGNKMISGARIVIKKNEIQAVMLFAFLATWASVWQVVFLPYYFYKVMHFGVLPSALLSSLVLLSGAVGKVVMGRVSDTIGREKVLLISSLLVVSSFLIFFFVSNFEVSFAGALMMGSSALPSFPLCKLWPQSTRRVPREHPSA